jgi:predicted Rdx family selenoprotein
VARLDNQNEFQAAAAEEGIELVDQSVAWLCYRGHWALPAGSVARELLDRIWQALKGDSEGYGARPATPLTGDFLHEPTSTLIEYDETQHFSSARLITLRLYPPTQPLGFDRDAYIKLCQRWRRDADSKWKNKEATGFPGAHGRQRQRAYYDALRDLATPAMGGPPLVRVADPFDNGRAAWERHRDGLLALLS